MPTRSQRNEISIELLRLEGVLNSSGNVSSEDISSLTLKMESYGFSPVSAYYERVRRLEGKLQQPDFEKEGKRDYIGVIEGEFVQAMPIYDHVFLSGVYRKEVRYRKTRIRVSWRFNEEGRIDLIDTKTLETQDTRFIGSIRHLLTVKEYKEAGAEKDWEIAEAYYLSIVPQEMLCFRDGFLSLPRQEKYQVLLESGHDMAGLIIRGITDQSIERLNPRQRQMPLSRIPEDDAAIYMINNAAGLYPSVSLEGKRMIIEYNKH